MMILKNFGLSALLGALFACGTFSCSDEPPPPGGGDGDGDADSDADGDADVNGISVMPSADGRLEAQDNTLGMQGAWYTFGGDGAVFTPAEGDAFARSAEGMCFSGTAPQVTDVNGDGDPDYPDIWGAGCGFDVCANGADDTPADTKYTLGTCPYNSDLADMVTGVEVDITGEVNAGTNALRIIFNEGDNIANAYVEAPGVPGTVSALFSEATLGYDPSTRIQTNVATVKAIQFLIPTNDSAAVDWDFCITDVRMLIAE